MRSSQSRSGCLEMFWRFRKSAVIIFTPILLLPLPVLAQSQVANCIFLVSLMGVYWATEACPLAVTSLLPFILCPMFGMQDANTVASNYINHAVFLVIGTLIICIAIEETGLHRRIALTALSWFGSEPCWILLGLMIITAFLSMWLMNMSTLSLMLPVALAVCKEMENLPYDITESTVLTKEPREERIETVSFNDAHSDANNGTSLTINDAENNCKDIITRQEKQLSSSLNIQKAILLGICYSSTIGGVSTLVGTPTNMIGLGIFLDRYNDSSVNFVTWMSFTFPISLTGLFFTWIWLALRFLGIRNLIKRRKTNASNMARNIRYLRNDLPQMSFAEKAVGAHFLILVILWVFRDPKLFPGWRSIFPRGLTKDSTAAVLVGVSIFLFPSRSSSFTWIWNRNLDESAAIPSPPLLKWSTFQQKFPWNVLLLVGAGFAIAGACLDSGLSESIGVSLADGLKDSPQWLIIFTISIITSIVTEFASNSAMVAVLLPILLSISQQTGLSPIAILLTVTLSGSFAFSLPVATPCNALIFSTGAISIPDMIMTGLPLNLAFGVLLNIMINFVGPLLFDFEDPMMTSTGKNLTWLQSNASNRL